MSDKFDTQHLRSVFGGGAKFGLLEAKVTLTALGLHIRHQSPAAKDVLAAAHAALDNKIRAVDAIGAGESPVELVAS